MLRHTGRLNEPTPVGLVQHVIPGGAADLAEVLLIGRSDENKLPSARYEFFMLVDMPGIYDAAALRQFHKTAYEVA